jgi:hypothetical protein
MKSIGAHETRIVGRWEERNGALVPDDTCRRIDEILASGQLTEVARAEDGWSILYRDVRDGRYWELTYPQSELPGGGPPALINLSEEEARNHFGLSG